MRTQSRNLGREWWVLVLVAGVGLVGPVLGQEETEEQVPAVMGPADVRRTLQEMKVPFQEVKKEGLAIDLILEVELESGPALLLMKGNRLRLTRSFPGEIETLERLNEWNRRQRFGRAFTHEDMKGTHFSYDIDLGPFLPRKTVGQFISVFDTVIPQFQAFLEGKPLDEAGGEQVAARSVESGPTRLPEMGIVVKLEPRGEQAGSYRAIVQGEPKPGSPAALVRLAAGDFLVSVNNRAITGVRDLQRLSGLVLLEFLNKDTLLKHVVEMDLGGLEKQPGVKQEVEDTIPATAESLGLVLLKNVRVYPPPPPPYYGPDRDRPIGPGTEPPVEGVQVGRVEPDSVAARAGIRAGDVIYMTWQQDGEPDFLVNIPTLEDRIARAEGKIKLVWLVGGVYRNSRDAELSW